LFILTFTACQAQTDPRDIHPSGPGADPNSPLIGTEWRKDIYGTVNLYFDTAETARCIDNDTYSYDYTYDKSTRKGQVDSCGNFTVTADYEKLIFPSWKQYGHETVFTRVR
jgi:hypothetical protein